MAVLRLFAGARDAAGTGRDDVPGETVAEVLARRAGPVRADVRRGPRALPDLVQRRAVRARGRGGRHRRGGGAAARVGRRALMAAGTAPRAKRKPVYQEVEERDAARLSSKVRAKRAKRSQRLRRRYAVPYDIEGPKVRLGLAWFVVAAAALAVGPLPTAVVYGVAAAAAAAQTARAWRRRGQRPNEVVAAAMAGAMGAGACLTAGGTGLALIGGALVACGVANRDSGSPNAMLADAGWTLQCAMFPGAVAASMVLLARLDQGSAIALLLLVSAYETGDYLVGTGAGEPLRRAGRRPLRHRRHHLHRVDHPDLDAGLRRGLGLRRDRRGRRAPRAAVRLGAAPGRRGARLGPQAARLPAARGPDLVLGRGPRALRSAQPFRFSAAKSQLARLSRKALT